MLFNKDAVEQLNEESKYNKIGGGTTEYPNKNSTPHTIYKINSK